MSKGRIIERFCLVTLTVILILILPVSATRTVISPRLSNGRIWKNAPRTVYLYIDPANGWATGSAERTAATYGLGIWNAVKSYSGRSMITFTLTSDQSVQSNIKKMNDPNVRYIGYTWAHPDSANYFTWFQIDINYAKGISVGGSATTYDLQSVVTHEMGHALGIAHCHETNPDNNDSNLMNPSTPKNIQRRYLQAYDRDSYQLVYYNI